MKRNLPTLKDYQNSACAGLNPHLFEEVEVKKKSKYRNTRTEVDGIKFQSEKEAKRYGQLKIMMKVGMIGMLELQKRYLLIEANEIENKCEYYADFVYIESKTGKTIVEDVKSEATRKLSTYIMKRKLMLDKYGIKIKEV